MSELSMGEKAVLLAIRVTELEAELEAARTLGSDERGTYTVSLAHHNASARRLRGLKSKAKRLRRACTSTLECIRAGAEPWMLADLEIQVELALEPVEAKR